MSEKNQQRYKLIYILKLLQYFQEQKTLKR